MRFEYKRGPKRRGGEKKNTFDKLKNLIFFLLFFIIPFPLHFKDDFSSLTNILNH
jgi:hypothetical protein